MGWRVISAGISISVGDVGPWLVLAATIGRAARCAIRGTTESTTDFRPSGSAGQRSAATASARCGGHAKGLGSAAVPSTRATASAGNLPVELTSFVGRRQGLADLRRALASARLVTLTGVGGVGKTRLALRAGRESSRQYPDGVWFVEIAPVQDPALLPHAVFSALGLQDHSANRAVSTVCEYLADKRPLLILDNCEHVHDDAAVLAGTVLRACPDVRILATSRQALGVTGEVVIDVPTLTLPDEGDASPEALLRSDAVALFVERAGAVQQGFAVDAANAAAIRRVCSHVDGIPLALELAAVRLNGL